MRSSTFSSSWQYTGHKSHAHHFESTTDIKTIFRMKVVFTNFSYDQSQLNRIKDLANFYGAVHLPLGKLTLAQGIGLMTYRDRKRHSGPATTFQIRYMTASNLRLEIETESAYVQKYFDQKLRAGLYYGLQMLKIQFAYRWMKLQKEVIKGPEIGLSVQF